MFEKIELSLDIREFTFCLQGWFDCLNRPNPTRTEELEGLRDKLDCEQSLNFLLSHIRSRTRDRGERA